MMKRSLIKFLLLLINLVTFWCQESVVSGDSNENSVFYDLRAERCCNGIVHTVVKSQFQKCCGTELIDTTKQMCCKQLPLDLKPGYHCCGNSTYNTDTEVCCDGKAIEKINKKDKCCGNQLYNSATQVCCSAKPTPLMAQKTTPEAFICCGDKAYEKGAGLCCGSRLNKTMNLVTHMKVPHCCGSEAYDASLTLRCCANQVSYNPQTQMCCVDSYQSPPQVKVVSSGDRLRCCGTESFNSVSQTCCGGKVVNKPENGKGICCSKK